ncbi:MAG: aminopeptidase P family protein [Planctomycetaceae bacterium]|nr:aminopeptidase P family protein [Planctomycetaceae bacterium]
MLTEAGCRARRERLWEKLPREVDWVIVTEPAHLIYFADFCPSPFVFNSQNARGILLLGRSGEAVLIADNLLELYLKSAFVSERVMPVWYHCVESAGDRGSLLVATALARLASCAGRSFAYEPSCCPAGLLDGLRAIRPGLALTDLTPIVGALRRAKHADEIALIRRSLKVATAGLRAAMREIQPGMTELDAYRLVQRVAGEAAGAQVLVYGDFVSGPRCEQVGGAPSDRVVKAGELVLLDFSAVIGGYRGDFCNTFVCAGQPSPQQLELFNACLAAMQAGERSLRAGVSGRVVDAAVRQVMTQRGLGDRFPHHAGHGVGLGHPEAPFLVPESSETLVAGDVVTLEPGAYVPGVGGMRYERNYLITGGGYESLSDHPISIDAPV